MIHQRQHHNRLIDMKKIVSIGTILLILAGCAVGPKYARPKTKKPEAYVQAPTKSDSITNLKWWNVYQDTALQKLIRIAVDSNLDLSTAIARVDEAKAILGYNKANLYPFFDYSLRARASDFRSSSEQAAIAFTPNSVATLGNVSWEIDLWGKLRHANRAAYADLMSTDEARMRSQPMIQATSSPSVA